MNKQQLAQKIWASANQMRSKIEASEYKDFILGFIFYKYLSDKEIEFRERCCRFSETFFQAWLSSKLAACHTYADEG